jgi:hypothetical protein
MDSWGMTYFSHLTKGVMDDYDVNVTNDLAESFL